MVRIRHLKTALSAAAAALLLAGAAQAAGTLIIGMTAGDLPQTTGNPDQGFEGYRFVGYNLYDSLILWDLSQGEKAADIKPGLATEWHIDEGDSKRWIFKLREGVKWHDGCPFTADDVVWNFGYSSNEKAPQFNAAQFAQARAYLGTYAGVEKIDDHTVAFTTKVPDALFPYMMSYVLMISPCRAKEVNNNWTEYAQHPSGTGPYKFDKTVAHQRLEFVPNTDYWDKNRVPKQDRLVLIPMPEASTRTAALLAGEVNWIEAPSPDALDRLKSGGMQIVTKIYPHNWSYQLNFVKGPFADKRVRQAANYALNRTDMKDLLNGLMLEETATVTPSAAYYGHPKIYNYDPDKAKALLKEANCLPCKVKFAISTSGSGQMQLLPMNELVKSQLDAAGFEVTLDTMDWNALLKLGREGVDEHLDVNAINISRAMQDPFNALIRHVWTGAWAPKGANWGHFGNPDVDKLIASIILYAIPIAFGVSVVCFSLVYIAPGDPLQTVMPPDATAETIEIVKHAYGFDKPIPMQYLIWLGRLVTGDLGMSIATRRPVILEVTDALSNTSLLALFAVPLSFGVGYTMGAIAGCFPGGWLDRLVTGTAVVGVSLPNYWLGIVLVVVFAVEYSLLPATGMGPSGSTNFHILEWSSARYLILPVWTLSMIPVGILSRTIQPFLFQPPQPLYLMPQGN